jgi:hypothetical protein
MYDHGASMELEYAVRRALDCGRGGIAGLANADSIDIGNGFTALVAALAPYYVRADADTQVKINEFLDRYRVLDAKKSGEVAEEIKSAAKELKSLLDSFNVPLR